jgi:hypothetical protein
VPFRVLPGARRGAGHARRAPIAAEPRTHLGRALVRTAAGLLPAGAGARGAPEGRNGRAEGLIAASEVVARVRFPDPASNWAAEAAKGARACMPAPSRARQFGRMPCPWNPSRPGPVRTCPLRSWGAPGVALAPAACQWPCQSAASHGRGHGPRPPRTWPSAAAAPVVTFGPRPAGGRADHQAQSGRHGDAVPLAVAATAPGHWRDRPAQPRER